ncbi:putative protein kinase RLK-Pelle-RLCK-Os family [Rosa chinensis]|uniref:Serine-threonine/tyrosine-protein kinase catalytic domain-containing protein n=1 Tax=Rosa chinensis TaxID=74649 RepID=A0A2P6SAC5_ROSCH|nr:putative protein kinase RLK-Pelle-RLCK-Os family [Rosa chinensis]
MLLTNFRGTAGYAALEMWKPYPMTHKCDVYSFGIFLFEIVGRRRHCDDNVSESRDWLPKWTWNMFEKNDLAALLLHCGIEERLERQGKSREDVNDSSVVHSAFTRSKTSHEQCSANVGGA